MKIDIHTHILPKSWPNLDEKFGYGGWISLDHHTATSAKMMKNNECFRIIECNIINDNIAKIVADYPKKFIGLGNIPMQDEKLAIKELERCMGDLGMRGIQIGSNINGNNLSDESIYPIFEAANELGAAIFIHPWDMMGSEEMQKYWLPWLVGMPAETSRAICSLIFGGVLEKYSNLKFAFSHGGGSFPFTLGRIDHGYTMRPDLCAVDNRTLPSEYVGKFYIDSLVHDENILLFLINQMGHDKIALGSDFPFPLGEKKPGQLIQNLNVSNKIKQRMLAGTALEWLGLNEQNYIH